MAIRYSRENYNLLHEEIDRIFRELLRSDPAAELALETLVVPPVDIYETSRDIFLEMEIPGADPDKIHITFSSGRLIIEGEKQEMVEEGRQNYACMERTFGRFQRVIPMNRAVDLNDTKASYRQGILTVKFPKMPEKRGESITIPVKRIADHEEAP